MVEVGEFTQVPGESSEFAKRGVARFCKKLLLIGSLGVAWCKGLGTAWILNRYLAFLKLCQSVFHYSTERRRDHVERKVSGSS
jgi:hypothetical protein